MSVFLYMKVILAILGLSSRVSSPLQRFRLSLSMSLRGFSQLLCITFYCPFSSLYIYCLPACICIVSYMCNLQSDELFMFVLSPSASAAPRRHYPLCHVCVFRWIVAHAVSFSHTWRHEFSDAPVHRFTCIPDSMHTWNTKTHVCVDDDRITRVVGSRPAQ